MSKWLILLFISNGFAADSQTRLKTLSNLINTFDDDWQAEKQLVEIITQAYSDPALALDLQKAGLVLAVDSFYTRMNESDRLTRNSKSKLYSHAFSDPYNIGLRVWKLYRMNPTLYQEYLDRIPINWIPIMARHSTLVGPANRGENQAIFEEVMSYATETLIEGDLSKAKEWFIAMADPQNRVEDHSQVLLPFLNRALRRMSARRRTELFAVVERTGDFHTILQEIFVSDSILASLKPPFWRAQLLENETFLAEVFRTSIKMKEEIFDELRFLQKKGFRSSDVDELIGRAIDEHPDWVSHFTLFLHSCNKELRRLLPKVGLTN